MKKYFTISFTICCLISNLTLFAQTEQSTWLLGGSASFTNTSFDGNDIFSTQIAPNLGYFVTNNFSVGAEIPFVYNSSDGFNSSSIGFLPSLRYYFGQNNARKFFVNAYGGVISNRTKFEFQSEAETDTNSTFGGRAGVAFFLNKNIALETAVNYQSFSEEASVNRLSLNIGFQIHFGNSSGE